MSAAAILMDDNPLLRTVSAPVESFPVTDLVELMIETLKHHGGRGLAAVQIGVPLRVLIIREGSGYPVMVNPTIDRTLQRCTMEQEGCLSVPRHKWDYVRRPAKCDVTWSDATGKLRSATLSGEYARIFQHEYDHLEGVLMTDRISQQLRGE